MKATIFFTTLLLSVIIFGCNPKSEDPLPTDPHPPIPYNADLKGASETPPNQSTATGYANFFLNQYTKVLYGQVHFSGISPTAGHIHVGDSGVSGPVLFPLGQMHSGYFEFSHSLDSTQVAKLDSGKLYVNIHSTAFPDGEIRGQLHRQK